MIPLNGWAVAAAVVGIALPIAIHFLTRPRGQRQILPTFRFLAGSAQNSLRRNRLRAILILTARTLAILLITLGFARFVDRDPNAAGAADLRKRKVIILDCSLSMRAADDGAPLFDQARVQTQQTLADDDLFEADLILAARTSRAVFGRPSANLTALRDEAGRARALPQSLNVTAAIEAAARSLAGLPEDDLKRCEVVIFSDLQRSNWTQAVFASLPKTVPVRVVALRSGEPPANIAVIKARIDGLPEFGAPVQAIADVANLGTTNADVDVELLLDGRSWKKKLTLAAGATEPVAIELAGLEPGWRHGEFRVAQRSGLPDALPDDDRHPLSVFIRPARRPALITVERAGEVGGPAYFLERALAASPDATVKVARFVPGQLDGDIDEALAKSDLLAFANCGTLNDAQAAAAARLISAGTPALFITGTNADFDNLKALQAALGPALRLPVDFQPYRDSGRASPASSVFGPRAGNAESGGRFIVWADTERRPFKIFGEAMTRFNQTLRLGGGLASAPRAEPGLDTSAILARYSDGSAALVTAPVASGRLTILNMAVGGEGQHLGSHPIFVPVIQELCQDLLETATVRGGRTFVAGAPVLLTLPKTTAPASPTNATPSPTTGTEWKLIRAGASSDAIEGPSPEFKSDTGGASFYWPAAGEPGVYFVEQRGQPVAGFTVAAPFNEESPLAALDADVLTKRLAADRTLTVAAPRDAETGGSSGERHLEFFFVGALALLFLELGLLKFFRS